MFPSHELSCAGKTSKNGNSKSKAKTQGKASSKENASLTGNSGNGEEPDGKTKGAKNRPSGPPGKVARKSGEKNSLEETKKQPTLSAFLKPVKQ